MMNRDEIVITGANEHNLNDLSLSIPRNRITVITGVSGSGKSSLAFDTILAECQRRFFYTLSNYSRQFLDLGTRPDVKQISGLSPAISLEQNETQPSRRSTVSTITDVGELLGVLFSRFGEKNCPIHGNPTAPMDIDKIVENILLNFNGQLLAITAPIVENKKGVFKVVLNKAFNKGFYRAFIDGEVVSIDPVPNLNKEIKHTIKLIFDYVKISKKSRDRLKRAIRHVIDLNEGFGELFIAEKQGQIDLKTKTVFSTKDGCSECGFSWNRIDARYFSSNSLGKCQNCFGYGLDPSSYHYEEESDLEFVKSAGEVPCEVCSGTGLDPKYDAIKIANMCVRDLYQLPIRELVKSVEGLSSGQLSNNPAFTRVHEKIVSQLMRLLDIGLDYLHLGRRVLTLSGGEGQRLKLAGILSEQLCGVIYVLDEPSQGLHPFELEVVWKNLEKLKNMGNTLIIVDHDSFFIKRADLVIDLGPGGGKFGGNVQAVFEPREMKNYVGVSKTAAAICSSETQVNFPNSEPATDFLTLKNIQLHNLQIDSVSFQLKALNVVTGISGAGKTSLVFGVIVPNLVESAPEVARGYELEDDWYFTDRIIGYEKIDNIKVVDRKSLAKSSVSMPATYLDCFKYLRELYGKLPDAQIYGITAKHFSFASDLGRCPECKGRGYVTLSMRFLPDAKEKCSHCDGRRYQDEVLAIKYNGYSLSDLLSLTIQEVYDLFAHHKQLEKRLKPALDLGLGYLKFGQPSSSLSGGEAQRLKLVPLLTKNWGTGGLLILDEPTRGLHFDDVNLLLKCLKKIVSKGASVILIEHHASVIQASDWVVDLGPGSAQAGGKVVYQGALSDFLDSDSKTASYLS